MDRNIRVATKEMVDKWQKLRVAATGCSQPIAQATMLQGKRQLTSAVTKSLEGAEAQVTTD